MHSPFNVTVPEVADPDLGPLLTKLADAGYPDPVVQPVGATSAVAPTPAAKVGTTEGDLPAEWRTVKELDDQSYQWPTYTETYDSYKVYSANTDREGTVHIALGEAPRADAWGRDRKYVVGFLTSGNPQTPLVEFLETDPEGSGEMLAVIRGRDGGRKMYGPADSMPDIYNEFRTGMYRDHIKAPGSWNKVAVIAAEDDHAAMLNHALVQARRRGDV